MYIQQQQLQIKLTNGLHSLQCFLKFAQLYIVLLSSSAPFLANLRVPKAVKTRMCPKFCTNPILNHAKSLFHKYVDFFGYVYYIVKNYMPVIEQIADSLTKIGLMQKFTIWFLPSYSSSADAFLCLSYKINKHSDNVVFNSLFFVENSIALKFIFILNFLNSQFIISNVE